MDIGIGNEIVYGFYLHFVRPFMYPYTQKNSVSTRKYPTLSILLHFDALKFLGLYPPTWNKAIHSTNYANNIHNNSSKQLSCLEIHRHLVQTVKIPKNILFLYLSSLVLLLNISQPEIYLYNNIAMVTLCLACGITEYIITIFSL